MTIIDQKEEEEEEEVKVGKSNNIAIVPTTTTLATIESLTFPIVQEVVFLADFRCKSCQDRVAHIVSRLNGEADSVEISLMEKRVTITLAHRRPRVAKMPENELQRAVIYKNITKKSSLVKRIFCPTFA
ncbi:hypothetical protein OSB04_008860 [Centaurea solstitialis]|uniref:HMA domain-containing protein n=1 Tax=Centaurea solstitialis TaxID=347529 RepID=A0AA38TMK5_9ASTR|nr:hypothetical protein OSB04_008860 [Centaurea solstitialis]